MANTSRTWCDMANLMYMEMGQSLISNVASYGVSLQESKLAKSMQRYKQMMSDLSAALSQNAVTLNEIETSDKMTNAKLDLESKAMADQANYAVEAAAAGLIGQSIGLGSTVREADAARAGVSLQRSYDEQRRAFGAQRTQIELDRIYGKDISVISNPSIGGALFNAGTDLADVWDAHNPVDRRISSRLEQDTR